MHRTMSLKKTKSFAFCGKKPFSMKLADLRDMFKKASKIASTSAVVVSPDPLSPTPYLYISCCDIS